MSRIFGVTTDYLLKDELEEAEALEVSAEDTPIRRVFRRRTLPMWSLYVCCFSL